MSLDMGGRETEYTEPSTRSHKAKGKKATKKVSQGQAGPRLEMGWGDTSKNEKRVLKAMLPAPGEHRKPMTIGEIAEETGWVKRFGQAKANSWVRNQLRRLVRADLVEHAEKIKDGRYILTDYGKRQVRAHVDHRHEHKHKQAPQPAPTTDSQPPATEVQQLTPEPMSPVSF